MQTAFGHRRSIRLHSIDYSHPGNYFATICLADKRLTLGEIHDGKMILNATGEVVREAWFEMPSRFPSIELREFVVMPNHVHAIIGLTRPISRLSRRSQNREGAASSAPTIAFRQPILGEVIRAFKSISAIRLNRLSSRSGSVWQRNYFERIVRDEKEYRQIQKYIHENPMRWLEDPEKAAEYLRS